MDVTDPHAQGSLEEQASRLRHERPEEHAVPRVLGAYVSTVEQTLMPLHEPAWEVVLELRRVLG